MTNNDDDLGGSAPDFSSFGSPIETPTPDAAPEPAPRRSAFAWAPDVDDALETASKEFGVDRGLLDTFARIESSGRPHVQTGSYKGLFQLSDAEFFKHGGQSNPFDPYENARAGAAKLRAEKADFAKRYGRDPTAAELYMIHQQGVGGSAAHWANPDAPAWQNMYSTGEGRQKGANWARRAIWGNVPDDVKRRYGSVDNLTSRDFVKLWEDKIARFGGGSAASSFPTAAGPAPASNPGALPDLGNLVASKQVPGSRPVGMMGLGSTVSDDEDEETEGSDLLLPTSYENAEDDEDGADPETDNDSPMYLGGPSEDKPDFSRFGKPLGKAATPAGTSGPDFSKFGKPVGKPVLDANDPAADQKPAAKDGGGFWDNAAEFANPQQYKEIAKGVIPGAISMQGTALQMPDAAVSGVQHRTIQRAKQQLAVMDRIDAGEKVEDFQAKGPRANWDTDDYFGYQQMTPEQRATQRGRLEKEVAEFNPAPIQDRYLYKKGEEVQEYAKNLMPAAPGYEKSVGRQLGEGLGSMAGGMPYGILGRVPAGLFFGAAGAGEATQRAVEFDKKERKEGREGLTQEQIALAGVMGIAPGTTDLLPLETLMGRLPIPVPEAAKKPLAQAIARIGGQAFIEGLQEGGQQFLQNLIAREVYNPKQELGDEVLGNTGIGAGVGGIAQTGKEVGAGLVKLAGGRRGRHAGSAPEAEEDEGQKALPAPPKQITGPQGEQPAQENVPPPASAEEAGWLRAQGWDDKAIAEMSPDQRAAEIEEAKAQGLKPVAGAARAPQLAPDNPTAEPVTDLLAQAADLNDPKSERSGVYVPASSLDALDQAGAEKLSQAMGDNLVLQNFDGKGGHLVVSDYETATKALEAKQAGEDLQSIIGQATGAGRGKPSNGSIVVQQRTKDGAVVRESLVSPDQVDATRKAFARAGHQVEVLSPQEALQRREEMIAQQSAAAPAPAPSTRTSPVAIEKPEDVAAVVAPSDYSPAQGEANNRRLGHAKWNGLDISIETDGDNVRRGQTKEGREWKSRMGAPYGYFKNTLGADDMHVDVFVGPNPTSDTVYVLDENDKKTGKFRQHKTFIGFDSEADVRQAYAASSNKSEEQIGGITEMDADIFKDWLADGKKTIPAADEFKRVDEPKAPRRWDGPELSPDDVDLLVTNWKYIRDVAAMPKPETLAQFVISNGGLQDGAREVRHIMGAAKERPGLVNKGGVTLDDMALKAWESGFFEGSERPTIADFLDKLQDDLHTGAEVRLIDQDALDSVKIAGEIAEELNEYGITASSFRSEASLREYLGQARAKAARPAEDAEGAQATGREGTGRPGDSVDEVPFGSEPEDGRQDAVARDEAGDGERAGAVRDREDQDQQGAEPAARARDSGEDRGPAGTGQAGRGSDVAGARETGPSDSGAAQSWWRYELTPAGRQLAAADAGLKKGRHKVAWQHLTEDEQTALARTYEQSYKPKAEEPAITTEKSGQTSLAPEPTTKERIAAEAKAKARKGGNEPMDEGLFGSGKDQTDLVDMAKAPAKKADPFKGEMPDEPDFDFIPNQGWRDHLMRARVYATALRIDHRGKSLEEIVQAIDDATTAHAGVPDGVKVWMSDNTLDAEDARMKGGEWHAYAQREKPYSVVDGYGDTPEAAMRNAVENLKPAKASRLGQGLGDLMGKSGGQAKAVETVAAGAKAPTETAAPVEVSEDVAAALERGKEKARAHVLRLGRQNGTEFGMMVLKDGSTKANKVDGTVNFLRVDEETAPEMWTGEPKTVDFHHNHPKSTSLSKADYTEAAVRPALRRTWVHGHDGSEYWAEFKADAETLGKAYDIARAVTETVDKKGMQMFRYRGHIIAQMMKQGGVIDYYADMTPADAEERIEAIRAAIGEEKIADAIEDIANLKETADGLLDRGTGSAGRQSQDVGTAPDQAAEAAAGSPRGEVGDAVRPAEDQAEAARGDDQDALDLTPEEALQERLIDKGFKTIVEARKFAAGLGITGSNKEIDETIEKAVVQAARSIVLNALTSDISGQANQRETFDALLALYENQPNLSSRTGTSVANQAYSTPVPLAFVASRLAGVVGADHVLEPTAGNGALLIEAGQGTNDEVFANELDPSRAEALREQGFNVKSEDATDPDLVKPKSADAVIMNPPFGAVKDGGKSKVFEVDGWETTQIDHAIALNALNGMTDEGKAVLILGGTKSESTDERRKDYRGKAKREFYARLYKDYNVTDHFTVSGDLYTKQGASWPVDVIVIDGRGQSERKLPAAQPPVILKTWEQVAEKLPNATSAGRNELAARPVDRQAGKPDQSGAEPAGRDASDRKAPVGRGSERVQPEGEGKPAAVRAERARGEPADVGSRGRNDAAKPAGDRDGGRSDQPAAAQPVRSRVKREAPKGGQALYEPTSTAASLDTLIPVNMASAAREAMAKVEERRGSVDELVADRLGYDAKELSQYFSAEQVDALAAAIDNVERGAAFIIGDQTGIGKGRIAAGMLRYAMKKGMVPVFLTEKPDLYGDIFRDLRDIGVPEMLGREPRMFITNAGETITLDEEALSWKQESEEARRNGEPAPKKRGKFLVGGTAAKVQENMRKIASGDDIADVVFTTYDQLNTVKGATTPRRSFLSQIAPRAMIVMDEAHNAGGQVKTGWEKKDAVMNRADFARELAAKAKGVMFSSATYAKRPDVMDLYARTDMGKAVDDPKDLGELIQRGGVPMQQIVASMLAKSGQYLRRERSFDGVDYQLTPVPVNLKAYKQFSASMQAIFRFDLAVEEFRDQWGQDKLDEMGWKKSRDDGVGGGSASSVAFGSLMHNITNQMLLAIKAEQTAQQAIQAHKAGEKPVIALANTNESFIKDFAESEDIKSGQPLDLDFSAVLERYLERTLQITVKGPDKETKRIKIPVDDLPLSLRQEFRAAMNAVKEGDYSSLPISPIDWIRFRLGESGMSVKEVTGRQTMIDYSKPVPTYVQRPKSEQGASGKRGSISYFNAGKLDALILNRSGSTGVSMHASSSFKDQRRRRMILAQAEGNIDTHLQMLGRVHRTGQVIPPAYSQIAAEIPAEARPTAVLMKKMASLNANTTGARSSAFTVDSVDFINEVGDKVVADVLLEDPDLNVMLGEPLKFDDGKAKVEDIARKATGRLVLLDPEVQSRFLDQVQKAYLAEIEQLDALGENPLEAKTVDLQAKTIEASELKPKQGDSPFLDAVRMEKVTAKAQGRAMPPSEVAGKIADALKVSKPTGSDAQVLAALEAQGRAWGYKETDRVSALIRKQMAEEIAETGADSKESTRRRLEAQFSRWSETMGLVYPGARVRLGMQAGDLDAVVMSVERTGKAKQMGALSAWTVKFAVPDSMRQLDFPMSKLFPPNTPMGDGEKGATLRRAGASHNDLVDAFEQARKEGRETRYIMTGNILGGFDQTRGRGRIVNFTDEKGELRPGILMGREFSAEKFMDSRAVRFQNAGQIVEFMDKAPLATVQASQGSIELSQYRDTYRIEMASARAKAGQFFTDAAVRRALGQKEFEKRGNKMIVDGLSKAEFTTAVAEMQKIGAKFEVRDQQDLAQSIVSKPNDGGAAFAVGSDLEEAGVPKRTDYKSAIPDIRRAMGSILKSGRQVPIHGEVVSAVHSAVDEVRGMVPAGANVYALARVEPSEEPGTVIAVFADRDGNEVPFVQSWDYLSSIRALYFEGDIYFVRLSSRDLRDLGKFNGSVAAELGHEVVHTLRNSGALSGDTWNRLLSHAKALRLLDGDFGTYLKVVGDPAADKVQERTVRAIYKKIYSTYPNPTEHMDQEEVAHVLEWYMRGQLSRAEVEPIVDILDDIMAGRVQAETDEFAFHREMAFAAADQGRAQRRELDRLGFYSKALEAAKDLRQAKGTPEQMRAMLRTAGVKEAELQAVGFDAWLAERARAVSGEEAGRISQQDGFDTSTVWYRGDKREWGGVDHEEANPDFPRAMYLTTDRNLASWFTHGAEGSRVGKFHIRDRNLFDYAKSENIDPLVAHLSAADARTIYPGFLGPKSMLIDGARNGDAGILELPYIQDWIKAQGFTGWRMQENGKPTVGMYSESDVRPASQQAQQSVDRTERQPENRRSREPIITKEEIISFLRENRVEVKEGVYGGDKMDVIRRRGELEGERDRLQRQRFAQIRNGARLAEIADELAALDQRAETVSKWSTYSIDPSNPTYRETVIHLPAMPGTAEFEKSYGDIGERINAAEERGDTAEAARLQIEYDRMSDTAENLNSSRVNFTSGHWSEPNVIAHARTSLQKTADGKTVFLIDELQSDWGQKLRDGGVRDEAKIAELQKRLDDQTAKADAYIMGEPAAFVRSVIPTVAEIDRVSQVTKVLADIAAGFTSADNQEREKASEYRLEIDKLVSPMKLMDAELRTAKAATPGHPLVNTTDQWTTTAFRRLIRQAVEAGADYIALTPGKVQAERFNLDQQVSRIQLSNAVFGEDGKLVRGDLVVTAKSDGRDIFAEKRVPAARIQELIGKELTERLAEEGEISGDGLRFGGSGMKATYDSMYPRTLGKMLAKMDKAAGVMKDMPLKSSVSDTFFIATTPSSTEQIPFHTFPLTSKVKESVMEDGQPMFAIGGGGLQGSRKERAKAMGFDTSFVAYRGLTRPYDPAVAGDRNWQMFVRSPDVASGYAGDSDGANVIPSYLRLGKNLRIEASGARWDRIPGTAVPYAIKREANMPMDPVYSVGEIARGIKKLGYDSLTVVDVMDTVHPDVGGVSTVDVVYDPANVRSVNAAFDPAEDGSPQLMASAIPSVKQAAVSKDLSEAINIVNRIAGREVEVRFQETMDADRVSADQREATARAGFAADAPLGSYRRPTLNARAIITLATSNDDLLTTAGHEAWHHAETVLATDAERKLLSAPTEMRRMRAQVADEIGMDRADPRIEQIPDYEIRAIAFQKYRREREEGQQPQGIHIGIRRFWDRMLKILAVVRNALDGHGLKTYEDVFEAARTGEIASRQSEIPSPDAKNDGMVRQDEALAAEPQDVNDVMASLIPRVIKQSVARTMRRFEVGERVDRLRVGIQDKFLPVRRIQEEKERQTGTKVAINLDTYVAEALFHGRAGEQTADLKTDYIEPLVEILRKADISKAQFDSYLYARHAQERNAEIAKINPSLTAGSGMTDAEANAILASARGKQTAYDQAAKLVDAMIEETRTRLLKSGLISRETFDAWATKFANYVPLRGFEAGQDEADRPRAGRGFDIRGPEAMQALGRRSKADSPLAYALMQAQQAIIRAEKNRVDKTLYRFIQAYPDPSLYQIYKGEYRRRLNPVTKQVESYWVPPQFVRDDSIHGVKIGGKQYYMELKDPGLARAMRGVQGEQHNAVMRGMMTVSRFYASLLTSYNPEFVISNFMRDIQTALLNVTDVADKPKATRRQIIADALSMKSIRGVMNALRGDGTSDYAHWFEEYRQAGGKISFMEFNDVERIQRDVSKSIERGRFSRVTRNAFKLVEDLNTAVENGVRLSTYIAMRKAGIGQDRAAFVARDLTVNFNRKGEWSPLINSMYLFFNASVQGNVRMMQAVAKSRKLQVGVASIMGAAFMLDWWNYLVAGDDDDGRNRWDKLEHWKKERNLIIMTGRSDGSYVQIPMPYGYNLFWFGSQQVGAVMRGASKPHEAAVRMASSMIDVISPIGGASGSVYQMAAPTMIDPIVQVLENKNWYGGPIFPPKHNRHLPDSENAFDSVNPRFQDLARAINSATGGNTARKGAIDISPEVIEHFFEFAGGGVAKFINNVMASGGRAINGEEWLPEKTPFVRRVYGKATTESRRRDFHEAWQEVDAAKYEVDNLIKNTRKGTARVDEIEVARQKYAVELQAYGFMRDTQRALSSMRKERTAVDLNQSLTRAQKEEKLKEIQNRENGLILRSLGNLNSMRKRAKQSNPASTGVPGVQRFVDTDSDYAEALQGIDRLGTYKPGNRQSDMVEDRRGEGAYDPIPDAVDAADRMTPEFRGAMVRATRYGTQAAEPMGRYAARQMVQSDRLRRGGADIQPLPSSDDDDLVRLPR